MRKIMLSLVFILVAAVACAGGSKRPDWRVHDELKPDKVPYWVCTEAELELAKKQGKVEDLDRKNKWCSLYCPKEKRDGECEEEQVVRVRDTDKDEDWTFFENCDYVAVPPEYVFGE